MPPRARWSEIRKHSTNLGEKLNMASIALEEANTVLEGVLAGTSERAPPQVNAAARRQRH